MGFHKEYPAWLIFLRHTCVVVAGVLALPSILFWKDRARFYSYLCHVWLETSNKLVWMDQAEKATGDFYWLPSTTSRENHRRKRWRFSSFGVYTHSYGSFRSSNGPTIS